MTKHDNKHQDARVELYEVGYLVVPTVAEEQLPGVVAELHKIIEANDAKITSEGSPVMKELAYEMAKATVGKRQRFETAYFGFIVFEAETSAAPAIKKALDTQEKLLRYILIKTDEETVNAPKDVAEMLEGDVMPEEAKISEEELDKKIDVLVA